MNNKETILETAKLYLAIEMTLLNNDNNDKKTILTLCDKEICSEIKLISSGLIELKASRLNSLMNQYKYISKNRIVEKILSKKQKTELVTA